MRLLSFVVAKDGRRILDPMLGPLCATLLVLDCLSKLREHLLIDATQAHRSEGALEEAADAAAPLPGSGDLDLCCPTVLHGRERPGSGERRIEILFCDCLAFNGLCDLHAIRAFPSSRLQAIADLCSLANSPFLDCIVEEIGRQHGRTCVLIIDQGCVDLLRWGLDYSFALRGNTTHDNFASLFRCWNSSLLSVIRCMQPGVFLIRAYLPTSFILAQAGKGDTCYLINSRLRRPSSAPTRRQ